MSLDAAEVARLAIGEIWQPTPLKRCPGCGRMLPETIECFRRCGPGWLGRCRDCGPSSDFVPTRLVREAFERSGLSAAKLAERMGWLWGGRGDSPRVKRALGLIPQRSGNGEQARARTMRYRRAVEMITAMGLDPTDYGL